MVQAFNDAFLETVVSYSSDFLFDKIKQQKLLRCAEKFARYDCVNQLLKSFMEQQKPFLNIAEKLLAIYHI